MKKNGNILTAALLVVLFVLAGLMQYHHHHRHSAEMTGCVCYMLPWHDGCGHDCDDSGCGNPDSVPSGSCGLHLSDCDIVHQRNDVLADESCDFDFSAALPVCGHIKCRCHVCISSCHRPVADEGRPKRISVGTGALRAPPVYV